MGFTEKIKGVGLVAQENVKNISYSIVQISLRVVTAFFISLTLSLIGQQIVGYEVFGLIFVILVFGISIFKFLINWSIPKILIFDLICVLIAAVLRMYILIAP